MELIRPIVKVGNSAGVILPREWLNGKAKIELIARPLDIKKEIFEILEDYLPEIEGIYLVGSYARGEETEKSDIDVLAVTENIDKKFISGKYEIILISLSEMENQLNKNALPILPMLIEAKTITNEKLRKEYIKTRLNRKNLNFCIETTKTALNVVKQDIALSKELGEKNTNDSIIYSLILRLRILYIIDCINKKKLWNKREFLELVQKISDSCHAYEGYVRVKNGKKSLNETSVYGAEKLMNYIHHKIKEVEKWAKERKD